MPNYKFKNMTKLSINEVKSKVAEAKIRKMQEKQRKAIEDSNKY